MAGRAQLPRGQRYDAYCRWCDAFRRVGGNFYTLDSATGEKLWTTEVDGGIGGGVITYTDGGSQKVAVAAGFTSPVWPTKQVYAKAYVLGLDESTAKQ